MKMIWKFNIAFRTNFYELQTLKKLDTLFFPHDGKPNHFKALDGLRGLAILIVILSHTSGAKLFIHPLLNFKNFGKIGVYLFFVLSAYLLDRQITFAFIHGKISLKYWQNYFLRRSLRIFPLFIFALILNYLFTLIGIYSPINELMDIFKHVFLIKGESVFWSIPVEFKYYFFSPIILYCCHKFLHWDKRKVFVFLLGILIIAMLIQAFIPLSSPSTIRYLPVFLVGTFISIFEILFKKKIRKGSLLIDVSGLLAFLVIIITIPYLFHKIFDFEIDILSAYYYVHYSALWGIILLASKYGGGVVRKFLEFKLLRFIGVISFSLYLFHMLFIDLSIEINFPQSLRLYFVIISTFLFSCITYLFIERPMTQIRLYSKRINNKRFCINPKD